MVTLLPPVEKKHSFGQKFSNAIGSGLEMAQQHQQQKQQMQQENEVAKQMGFDLSGITDPKTRQQMFGLAMQGKNQKELESLKQQGKPNKQEENPSVLLEGAMDTLNRMKQLRKKGNLGIGSTISPFGQTRKEAGEYEQLGKSLIQYATNIPIRNKVEFEVLAEQLYDPTITDAKAEGILNAMQRIIENSMKATGGSEREQINQSQQKRPPLTAFQR
jgi:hypothetical protein